MKCHGAVQSKWEGEWLEYLVEFLLMDGGGGGGDR